LDFNRIGDSWSYKFYFIKTDSGKISLDVNKTGFNKDSFKVLSTAKSGLIKFIKEESPNALIFSAQSEEGLDISKRMKIYQDILISSVGDFPEYNYKIENISGNQIYTLFKKKLDNPDETFNNIREIIENYINFINSFNTLELDIEEYYKNVRIGIIKRK
jgi:superfamily I DNA and RNA helicase